MKSCNKRGRERETAKGGSKEDCERKTEREIKGGREEGMLEERDIAREEGKQDDRRGSEKERKEEEREKHSRK